MTNYYEKIIKITSYAPLLGVVLGQIGIIVALARGCYHEGIVASFNTISQVKINVNISTYLILVELTVIGLVFCTWEISKILRKFGGVPC